MKQTLRGRTSPSVAGGGGRPVVAQQQKQPSPPPPVAMNNNRINNGKRARSTADRVLPCGNSILSHNNNTSSLSSMTSSSSLHHHSPRNLLFNLGGGTLSILIMKCTLGCMFLLILVQGVMWVVNATSSTPMATNNNYYDRISSDGAYLAGLRGSADAVVMKQFGHERDVALQPMRRLYANKAATTTTTTKFHPMCQLLKSPSLSSSSAKQLWMNHVGAILAASQHADDKEYVLESWTKQLLSEISPHVLEQTTTSGGVNNNNVVANDPVLSDIMAGVLDVVYHKLMMPSDTTTATDAAETTSSSSPPPLRIAVLGGSHTEGTNCAQVSIPADTEEPLSPELATLTANPMFCAWPFRLESFINALAGFPLVEVINLAEDGTDTAFMTPLIQNGIYPPSLMPYGPDIILHAYRQSDYTIPTTTDSLSDTIQRELYLLLRGRSAPHPCRTRPPLVIHINDSAAAEIAMAELVTIQSSQVIQRAMEADHQTDPGSMAAHMALTWVTAFNLMDLTLKYCSSNHDNTQRALSTTEKNANTNINTTQCRRPQSSERSPSLSAAVAAAASPTCPFCFFASPLGTVRTTMELQHYIKGFVVHNDGWQILADMSTGWSRKIGLVAMQRNANVLFRVANIDRPVRNLHIMTLRSNGEEWRDGLARFRLAVIAPNAATMDENGQPQQQPQQQQLSPPQPSAETRFDVTGYHDSAKHMTYHFTVDMTQYEAPVGSDLMLSVELVEGSRFKILGLMLCS